jgi:UDP-2,3-diacylglucosamine pyrophosphatase LpxH
LESPAILEVLRRHRVLARHGDVFDPLHFSEERGASSLADAMGIELVNRFCQEMERHYVSDLPQMVRAGLREIDHIRPILFTPVWIDALLERSSSAPAVRRKVKHVWDQLVDEFLQLELVRSRESASPFDVIDGLAAALKFSAASSIDWPKRIQTWLQRVRGIEGESYLPHALGEPDFRNRRARHIVYGHTHVAETSPLEASYADGYVLQQTYFNTGSWRRVYRPAQGNPKSHELMPSECLQFNAFFHGDERSGRTFEAWSGMLDASGPERWMHRIDGSHHASSESISTSGVPRRGPHFDISVAAGTTTADITR